jgi:hypothetical protein
LLFMMNRLEVCNHVCARIIACAPADHGACLHQIAVFSFVGSTMRTLTCVCLRVRRVLDAAVTYGVKGELSDG